MNPLNGALRASKPSPAGDQGQSGSMRPDGP